MSSYNHCTLMGNLTRDPEVRYTTSGKAVCSFTIAMNHHFTDGNGEKKEEATFVEITFWGKAAEVCGRFLKQGSPVLVDGRLAMDSWEDKKTGEKKTKLKVMGENMRLIGPKSDGDSDRRQDNDSSPRSERKTLDQQAAEMDEDDIPF